jgi:hypothetical protein
MANFIYNESKRAIAAAEQDYDAPDDFRVLLNMTDTTVDTEDDVNTISAFTTLDEYDGAGYARQALAGDALGEDAGNNRAEYDANDSVFSGLGVGTRQAQNHLMLEHVTNDTDSVPIVFGDTGGYPFDGNGGDVTIQWNAEGIIQFA